MQGDASNWRLYAGTGEVRSGPLPPPPPWRRFDDRASTRSARYILGPEQVDVVNAAVQLRRPLLVTGRPGTGKSSLARSIAYELGLGDVLLWPVNSRSSLAEGLYSYDAVGRLRDAGRAREQGDPPLDMGSYLRLGPLGTALALSRPAAPRLLLVDEIDKGDLDLPNDLLVVLEEGRFEIPELARLPDDAPDTDVMITGGRQRHPVHQGIVQAQEFPIVVLTSNGERDFPAPFLRRCIRLDLQEPSEEQLREVVRAHLGEQGLREAEDLVASFVERRNLGRAVLATDQLLNAVHLRMTGVDLGRDGLLDAVLRPLEDSWPGL